MLLNCRKWRKVFLITGAVFLGLLLGGGAVFGASVIKRSQQIPGIDPLPLAPDNRAPGTTQNPDNKTRPDQPNPADKQQPPGRTDMPPGDPGYPKIRNLTVVPEPTQPYTAKLSWDAYPDSDTPIYLVRFSRPIVNRTLLYESYNLVSPPLPAGSRVFLDRDLPEGTYYYAAVTAFELSKNGRLELRPGVNYTEVPFVVYRQERPAEQTKKPENPTRSDVTHSDRDPNLTPADFMVTSLTLLNNDKGVVMNWDPIKVKGIEYEVYRSNEGLDTHEAVEKAVRLGRVREDTPFFTDEAPVEGKRVFYGVAVKDTITGKSYHDLKYGISYKEHTYKKPERQVRYDSFLPDSLTAFQVNRDTIQLLWVDPGPGVKKYHVYRHHTPINTPEQQQAAQDMGFALPGAAGFTDTGLSPGNYFYALLPVTSSGEFLQVFAPGQTFTTFGVVIRGAVAEEQKPANKTEEKPAEKVAEDKKPETKSEGVDPTDGKGIITDFRVDLQNGNVVHLAWSVRPGTKPATRLQLYRGSETLADAETLKQKGKLIGEFPPEEGATDDHLTEKGDYYYTLAEYDPARNAFRSLYFARRPLVFKGDQTEPANKTVDTNPPQKKPTEDTGEPDHRPVGPYDRRLEEILSGAFTRGQYEAAETMLEDLLSDKQLPASIRQKAAFYNGIVKFRLHDYAGALRIFRDPAVQAYDRERASFWYRISLERMQR